MSSDGEVPDRAVRLAEMLCARVCHDLAGAIGAVGTGAELLAEEMGPGNDALSLLVESAGAATSRLRFLRQALSGGDLPMAAAELARLTADYLASAPGAAKSLLDWQDGSAAPWPRAEARLLMNMVLLALDSLPRGGTIVVRGRPGSDVIAAVAAAGNGVVVGESATQLADPPPSGFGPRGAQGRYTRDLADQLGLAIRIEKEEYRVSYTAAPKP